MVLNFTESRFLFIYEIMLFIFAGMRDKIEKVRIGRGLSKSELCRRSGVSPTTYWRFINGGDISLSAYERLVDALGMLSSLDYRENVVCSSSDKPKLGDVVVGNDGSGPFVITGMAVPKRK